MSLKSDLCDWRSWAILLGVLLVFGIVGGIEFRGDQEFAAAVQNHIPKCSGLDACRIDGVRP
ncbi:MAG: hypothetical protein LBQ10_01245 [Desulfovibrio sp.]|nr:hypothetical protein [Desulfovibrio sp.]